MKGSENHIALRSFDLQSDGLIEHQELLNPFSTYVSLVEEEEEPAAKRFAEQRDRKFLNPLEVTLMEKQPNLMKKVSNLVRDKKFSVMIADDNGFNIFILKKFLEKIPGFKIIHYEASNGKKALEIFNEFNLLGAKQPIKLIYMDCKMAVMDGFEATREIRSLSEKGTHYESAIIGLTSFIGDEERTLAEQSGMNEIHLKPITESEFIELTLSYADRLRSNSSKEG